VAEHLLARAGILVRLLVKQVHNREISRTEMGVLSILVEGPRRITELAECEGVAQPTMTVLVKRLHERGWIERDGAPHDGRVVMVSITKAGSEAQRRFREQFLVAMRADLREQSDEQLRALSAATDSLGAFVEDLQQRTARS
jgi:DNA-binding MarR family transcriptional regulator